MLSVRDLKNDLRICVKHTYHVFLGGYLSNNYRDPFEIDRTLYFCGSQYIESQKALLFNDMVSYNNIMGALNEDVIKKVASQIKGYSDDKWREHCVEILKAYVSARLQSSNVLKDELLKITEDVIVFSSDTDLVLGTGVSLFALYADNPLYWDGDNLYGFVLTEVRDNLRKG